MVEEKFKVLIIDDDKIVSKTLGGIFVHFNSRYKLKDIDMIKNKLFDTVPSNKLSTLEKEIEYESVFQGEEGFKVFKKKLEEGHPYDLVICDMRMPPGWDGLKTMEEISKLNSNTMILLSSAYSDYNLTEVREKTNNVHIGLLEKPFKMDDVIDMILLKIEIKIEMDRP